MATRFWLSAQPVSSGLPALVPGVAAGWTRSVKLTQYRALTQRPDLSLRAQGNLFGAVTVSSSAMWQWVSDPLASAQSVAGTARFVLMCDQDTDQHAVLTLDLRVVKSDGTQRGLLFHGDVVAPDAVDPAPIGHYETRILNPALTAVAALPGDRIVVEVGFTTTAVPTNTANLNILFGAVAGVADLPYQRALQTTTLNSWLEFSQTLALAPEAPAPNTRLYLGGALAGTGVYTPWAAVPASVVPIPSGLWARTRAGFGRVPLWPRPIEGLGSNTALTVATLGSTVTSGLMFQQFISPPLDRAQTIAGTVTLVVGSWEQLATENAHLAFVLRVITATGAVRGTLASVMTTSTEFSTTPYNTRVHLAVPLTGLVCARGDRLVLEVGVWAVTPSNTSQVGLLVGCVPNIADMVAINDASSFGNPWLEFSQTVTFDTGTFLGVYDPEAVNPLTFTTLDWQLSVVLGSFQEEPREYRGNFRRTTSGALRSSQRVGKRTWHCTAEFASGDDLDRFLSFLDAAPVPDIPGGISSGSKVVQLYSDPLGALRTRVPQRVLVEVGAAPAFEQQLAGGGYSAGWSVDLTFRQV